MIENHINDLIQYGLSVGLITTEDKYYCTNQLLEILEVVEYEDGESIVNESLEEILMCLTDYAVKQGIVKEDTVTHRDLFDTKLMNVVMPRPSEVVRRFEEYYQCSPSEATNYFYKLSQDSDYIRRYRISKDVKWVVNTAFGEMDLTINLSKPEKDPKAIAAAKLRKQSGYPKCLLCKENVGFAGDLNRPARQNHRIIPITVNGQEWGFQYSPYVYYNEHCIVFNREHTPMKIERATFRKLLDFVKQFPHYFVGSNADLPIVGGSILTHDHFQGGHYEFAMAKAPMEEEFVVSGMDEVTLGIVKWPMSVIRIQGKDTEQLVNLADTILEAWRAYSDETVGIYAKTGEEPHNTITPIARKRGAIYEMDLVLRNNITTEEHPLGVFHPHQELHHIKKENIGLIEVMGLAVLPARLKEEMEVLGEYLVTGTSIEGNEMLEKHREWVAMLRDTYSEFTKDTVMDCLQKEIGIVFSQVLEHAGVFKCDQEGREAFQKFLLQLKVRQKIPV